MKNWIKFTKLKQSFVVSKRLLGMIWEADKIMLVFGVMAITVPSVIPFINAYIYKLIIDQLVTIVASTQVVSITAFIPLIVARIISYFIQDAAFSTQEYVERNLWTKFPIYNQSKLYQKIGELDVQTLEDAHFRDVLEQVGESLYRPQNLITGLMFSWQSLIQLLIAFAALTTLNWQLAIIIAIIAIPEFLYRMYESKTGWSIWAWHSPQKKRYTYLTGMFQNTDYLKEIKLYKLAPLFVQKIKNILTKYYKHNKILMNKAYAFRLVFNALSTVILIGIEVYVISLALAKRVTIGDISYYTAIVSNFQNGLGGLFRNLNDVFDASLYVESYFKILDTPQIIVDSKQAAPNTTNPAPLIEFRNVSFSYPGSKQNILTDFSLVIKPTEKVALVGENGAGKTTIIKLLTRLYEPTTGSIFVNGVDLRTISIDSWHSQLAVLFQDFNRYEDTVEDNILYGDIQKLPDDTVIKTAAHNAGAASVINTLEGKYKQMLGRTFENGQELSVGQWQKIALARAYFKNAPVLILDEPTAAIDARAEAEIFERVEVLSKNKTVLLISHRFSTVRHADRIVVLEHGEILEQGSHKQLMQNKSTYAELFTLQAKGYQK